MPKVTCPVCDAAFEVDANDLTLFSRVFCEECGSLLEVIEEDPLDLEVVEDEEEDEDELDEEEEDEDDSDYL